MSTGTKIEGLSNVKSWAKKFEKGVHNAEGARIDQFTAADEALAGQNNSRGGLYFDGFRAKIIGDAPVKPKKEEQDDASLALALQLQLEDEIALRKEQEEAASLRLLKELEAEEQSSANRQNTYRYY